MTTTVEQPARVGRPSEDESSLWLPPGRMRRYQLGKAAAGGVVVVTFVGWLFIQRSNVLMLVLASSLILVTVWVTVASILQDRRRYAGRQIQVAGGRVIITTPHTLRDVPAAAVASGRWLDEPEAQAGLWLFDCSGNARAHVDPAFLADQAEARSFLLWARQRADLAFDVAWPA